MASKMFSIPGDWSKESKAGTNTEAEVDKNVDNTSEVPRSVAGTVSDSGEVLSKGGSVIGKVDDTTKDAKDLAGAEVSEAGEILSKTGEVIGKADIDVDASDYTTEPAQEGEKKTQGGWFDKGKKLYNTVDGVSKPLGKVAGSLQSQNGQAPSEAPDAQGPVDGAVDGVKGVADGAADGAKDTVDDTKDTVDDTKDTADGVLDGTKSTADCTLGGAKDTAEEGAGKTDDLKEQDPTPIDDTKEQVPDADEVKDQVPEGEKLDETKDGAEGAVEETKEDAEGAVDETKDQVPDGEKLDETKEGAEGAVEETKEDAEGAVDETKDGADGEKLDETKDQVPEGEKLDETKDGADGAVEETKDGVEGAVDETKEGAEGTAEEATEQADKIDFSVLKGTTVNKAGKLVNSDGDIIGRIIEGDAKQLQGKKADADGQIWNESGKVIGKAEPVPDDERTDTKFAPFENFPDAVVEADGSITHDGRRVGTLVDGDAKKLKGSKVDEDGDVLDRNGNVVGKAEAWDEPEPEPEAEEEVPDRSILAGKRVNKLGNVCDQGGMIYGRVVEGHLQGMVGRMCDKDGNIRSESGDVLGKAEVVPEGEREGTKEGPFAELQGCTVTKEGKVVTAGGDVVGRLVSGDGKKLFGRSVDEDGDVLDANGNSIGKAERWEEPEAEPKKKGPLAGRKVNREGNVVDEDGNVLGKLVSGDLATCAGKEVDDDGDVINSKGNTVGHVSLLEDIPPEPTESEEDKKTREQAEADKELAKKLAGAVEQSLDKIRPICKMIDDKVDRAEKTPKEELDQEALVKELKPLLEEGNKILTECNGMIRGMDPDGRIQRNAKHKSSTKEASPEEHHLAEVLTELSGTVTKCIDNGKKKTEDMKHAKKELNPLWGLMAEPLAQILAAVGLLLNGVLGLVGRLLSGLGLGGLVDSILGGLGIDKLLDGITQALGVGKITGKLTGKE